ncbi:MAG: hypothetical protein WC736_06700 [Gallionella sp.]|jgi:hypothetical protein
MAKYFLVVFAWYQNDLCQGCGILPRGNMPHFQAGFSSLQFARLKIEDKKSGDAG